MPRSAEQFAEMRDASRARILDAALAQFAKRGYAGASVRAIAAEAGVSPGLIYAHFEGKEALVRAIYERSMDAVRGTATVALAEANPHARIARLIDAALSGVRADLDFWRMTYGLRMQAALIPGLARDIDRWVSETVGLLEQLLLAVGSTDAPADARALFAAIDGVAQHYALRPKKYPLEEVKAAMIRRFA